MTVDFDTGQPIASPEEDSEQKGAPAMGDNFTGRARKIDWAVADRIAVGASTILAGPPKRSFKTLLMLHLVECVARGKPWLGHATIARAAYFTGFEGGDAFLAQRVIEVGHECAFGPDEQPAPVFFGTGIDGYEWMMAKLRRAVARRELWPILWCVDTLSQVCAIKGIDENDNIEVTRFLQEHDDLVRKAGATQVWSHHFAKYHAQMRGAGAMSALCNWCEINPADGTAGLLRMDWTLRHGPGGVEGARVAKPNGTFTFEPVAAKDLPRRSYGRGGESRKDRVRSAVADYLRTRAGQGVTHSEIVARIKDEVGRTKTPLLEEVKEACAALFDELGLGTLTGAGSSGVTVPTRGNGEAGS